MKILITGSNGYLGRNLADGLQEHELGFFNRGTSIDYVKEFSPDVVIHTICSYGRNGETLSEIYESNFNVGLQLIETLKDQEVTFINCGSALPKFTNLYSISKTQLVELGKFYSNDSFQFINMNLQHFYGPGATNNFITFVMKECLKNNTIPLTEGLQERDFIYINDVVDAFKTIIETKESISNYANIDVGTGISTQLRKVILSIKEITNSSSVLEFGKVPMRENDEMRMIANTDSLNMLGWEPKINLDTGLAKVKDYYNEE